MTPSLYKIFCIGLIWFIYTLITFFRFLNYKFKQFIHFIRLLIIIFSYKSEKEYFRNINKSKSIKYPKNFAIVINKFLITEQKLILSLCQYIRWIILINEIKYFTIYDAFNLINIPKFLTELNENISNNEEIYGNIKIHICYKDKKNNKIKEINLVSGDKNKSTSDFYICIIGFEDANIDLIHKIIKEKETKIYNNYPEVYKWFNNQNKTGKDNQTKNMKKFQQFLTRKNEESLPELVAIFGKNKYLFYEDICLYGFPFTLLENSEIININHKQFDQLDILDFVDIFTINSKIVKRFGA